MLSPAPHVAVTVTSPKDQNSSDPRKSFCVSDLRAFSQRPTEQSGNMALENDLEATVLPGILCKRKERAPRFEASLEALKVADPPGRCQQRAGFEAITKAWPPS